MKFGSIALIATLALANVSHAGTKVVIYGDNSYPPYSFNEFGNELSGIYTLVLEQIFAKMPDYDISLEGIGWKQGLKMVEAGKIFALYPPYNRPKQRPYMDYDESILDEEVAVFCRKEVLSGAREAWPTDYLGLTIGNNAGFSAGGDEFWSLVKAGKVSVVEAEGTKANLLKLIDGKIDCYMNDGLSIEWELKHLAKKGEYDGSSIVRGATISGESGFLGFAVNADAFPYKEDFKQQYLKALRELKASGKVDKIIRQYMR